MSSVRSAYSDSAVSGLDVASCVPDVAEHLIVGEIGLLNHLRGVHRHLEYVVSRRYVSDVDPLAVDVGMIRVVATRTEPLCVRSAGKAPSHPRVTGRVLQAETGLVSLCHLLSSGDVQQVVITEGFHAVVMLVTAVPFPLMSGLHWEEVCCSLVLHSLWEPQQDSVVQVPHTGMIRRPGKTVFFSSTAKCVHLHSLDVRGSLDVVRVRNQVWETIVEEPGAISWSWWRAHMRDPVSAVWWVNIIEN